MQANALSEIDHLQAKTTLSRLHRRERHQKLRDYFYPVSSCLLDWKERSIIDYGLDGQAQKAASDNAGSRPTQGEADAVCRNYCQDSIRRLQSDRLTAEGSPGRGFVNERTPS